jgi:hypothetical protein
MHLQEYAMQVPWFFATTSTPQRQQPLQTQRRANHRPLTRWVVRTTERFVAWGERSRQRHSGSCSLI